MEKYLQVEWGSNMVFRDSLQFLSASLEQLAALLAKVGRENFQYLYDVVMDMYPEADVELLERKGVFCYDYLDSFARLDEPARPPREAFFNKTEAWSAHQRTMHTPSTCGITFTARVLKSTWRSTC